MANNHSTLTSLFKDIADAIRGRTGGTEPIQADAFPSAIRAINTEGLGSPGDYQALRGMIDTTFSGNYTNYSVKHIYSYAMSYCTKMENLAFPECLSCEPYAFNNITSLKTITLTKIGSLPSYTFQSCTNLTEVYIPGCKSLYEYVFYKLKKLSRVFADSLEYIGSRTFQEASIGSLYAPNVKGIWYAGFHLCNISHLSLPNLEYIAEFAFEECTLKEFEAPNVMIINNKAFYNARNISYISLGSKLTGTMPLVYNSLYASNLMKFSCCFWNCHALKEFHAPELTYLGYEMFRSCYSLETVDTPKVTYIDDAFNYCSSLKSVSFSECLSVSGGQTFWSCTSLQSVSLPKCSYMNGYVFGNCWSLKEVSLPALTALHTTSEGFFLNCSSLSRVILLNSSVVSLTGTVSNLFKNSPMTNIDLLGYFGSICVPGSLVSLYQVAAGWSLYSSRITEYTGS